MACWVYVHSVFVPARALVFFVTVGICYDHGMLGSESIMICMGGLAGSVIVYMSEPAGLDLADRP